MGKLNYIKYRIEEWESAQSNFRQYEVKLSRLHIGHTRLTHRHLMSRNDQYPACRNIVSENRESQSNIVFNGGIANKKYCIQNDIKVILEKRLR